MSLTILLPFTIAEGELMAISPKLWGTVVSWFPFGSLGDRH